MIIPIINYFVYNKNKYESFLDDENNKLWVFINQFISFLVILFIILISFESIWNNAVVFAKEILWFDAFISTVFGIEYFFRLFKAHSRYKFFIDPIRIIDLFSFLPFFIWLFHVWAFVVPLKLIRVFRVLKLVKKIPLTSWFIKSLKYYVDEYKAVFLLFWVALFLWSFFVYYIERDLPWTKFTSIPMSLWWGIVTMTTVWYWDIQPQSVMGRVIWSCIIFLWPILLALSSAVTVMVFRETNENSEHLKRSRRVKLCPRCETRNVTRAHYCIECWKKFPHIITK